MQVQQDFGFDQLGSTHVIVDVHYASQRENVSLDVIINSAHAHDGYSSLFVCVCVYVSFCYHSSACL